MHCSADDVSLFCRRRFLQELRRARRDGIVLQNGLSSRRKSGFWSPDKREICWCLDLKEGVSVCWVVCPSVRHAFGICERYVFLANLWQSLTSRTFIYGIWGKCARADRQESRFWCLNFVFFCYPFLFSPDNAVPRIVEAEERRGSPAFQISVENSAILRERSQVWREIQRDSWWLFVLISPICQGCVFQCHALLFTFQSSFCLRCYQYFHHSLLLGKSREISYNHS